MVKERVHLYEEEALNIADDEIAAMAKRFQVRKEDVVFAAWAIAKDMVWAKLALDLKERKKEKKARAQEQV